MRRAAPWVLAIGLLGAARSGAAESWTVTLEGGAEADSNVQRVETAPGAMAERIAAPVARAGARIEHSRALLDGVLAVNLSELARMVADARARDENAVLSSAQLRWLRPLAGRPVSAGLALTATDATALTGGVGARTFRNLGVDALLALGTGEDHRLLLAAGLRDFTYKPSHALDWWGPVASARLDVMLWQAEARTHSLELSLALGFEARTYASTAMIDVCDPSAPPSYDCVAQTSVVRRDRYQRAGLELTWTGALVVSAGYQLSVIDSNSYGWSLIRHRTTTSATIEVVPRLFATATATLQIDQFTGGVLVSPDAQQPELSGLEDENRSSLQLRLARAVSPTWSLEARGALWRDLGAQAGASFRRALVYAGVVYAR